MILITLDLAGHCDTNLKAKEKSKDSSGTVPSTPSPKP